jgi:hypothetical protein
MLLLILITISIAYFVESIYERQFKLSEVINETLNNVKSLVNTFEINTSQSYIEEVCMHAIERSMLQRTGCCTPSDVKHIHNAMFLNKQLVLFNDNSKLHDKLNIPLPVVTSVRAQQKLNFHVKTIVKTEKFNKLNCKSFFNGTLHVVGRSTSKNVYHAGF